MLRIHCLLLLLALASGGIVGAQQSTGTPIIPPHIYVTDAGNHRVIHIADMNGAGWTTFGSKGKGVGQIDSPLGISGDRRGRLYIADVFNNRVVRMDDMQGRNWASFRTLPHEAEGKPFDGPALSGLFVGATGRIYTANALFGQIASAEDMTGKRLRFYHPDGAKTLIFASSVCVDGSGRIYVSDRSGSIVRMNTIRGDGWIRYGKDGRKQSEFSQPNGICLDSRGRIYIADSGNNRIVRMEDMTGKGWTTFGQTGSQPGQFSAPTGICLDSQGRIYVVDTANHRIVRMDDMTGKNWVAVGRKGAGVGEFENAQGIFVR